MSKSKASGGYASLKPSKNSRVKTDEGTLNYQNALRSLEEEQVIELKRSWDNLTNKNYGGEHYSQANGIIQSLIDQGLYNRAIKGVLGAVGNGRIDRIRKNPVQQPRSSFKPHNAFSVEDLNRIKVFILCLDKEEGFT